jgi:hypothetical protein
MVLLVRGPVKLSALALTLAAIGGSPVGATASTHPTSRPAAADGPTTAQISGAVRKAQRSKDLWATVNVCNTGGHPNVVGIRGQMPGLGLTATMSMEFHATYWSATRRRFLEVPKAIKKLRLGAGVTGLHQDGVDFYFQPGAGLLSGEVTFQWRIGSKVVGSVTKQATKGHPSADFGDPTHFSAASCRIK